MREKPSDIPMPGPDLNPWPMHQQDPRVEMAVTLLKTAIDLLQQMTRPMPMSMEMEEETEKPSL